MQPIRFYLLIRLSQSWTASVHRDYESLLDTWKLYSGRLDITSIVHVGLQRSEFELFDNIASQYLGRVLLTASAKWSLHNLCKSTSQQIGLVEGIPLYLAIDGWGYTLKPQDLGLDLVDTQSLGNSYPPFSANSENKSNWICELKNSHTDIFNSASAAGIADEISYWQLEHCLPDPIRKKIGLYRFYSLSKDEILDDVVKILRCAPPWLLRVS